MDVSAFTNQARERRAREVVLTAVEEEASEGKTPGRHGRWRLGAAKIRLPEGIKPSKSCARAEFGAKRHGRMGFRNEVRSSGGSKTLEAKAQECCWGETDLAGEEEGPCGTARWKRRNAMSGLRWDLATPPLRNFFAPCAGEQEKVQEGCRVFLTRSPGASWDRAR